MKRTMLAVAIFSMFAANAALADPPGSGTTNGNGCIENCGNTPTGNGGNGGNGGSSTNTNTNQSTGTGIGYGIGGQGGNSTSSVGVGITSNPMGYGFSSASGGTGYGGSSTSGSTASATGGSASGGNANGTVNSSNSATNQGNNTNVNVQGDQAQPRNPVSTALAPIVYTGSDQCLVSVSIGVQAIGFGVAGGTAVADKNCEALKLSRELDRLGLKAAAIQLLMQDERVAKAIEAANAPK